MRIQERRLERGWSQEQLAEHSGLSVRTIQRLEQGKKASLETLKCLAAVFEVNVTDLVEEPAMQAKETTPDRFIEAREEAAIEYVKNLKGLYIHILIYVLLLLGLLALNYFISPGVWWIVYVAVPWTIALVVQASITFGVFNVLGPDWEQRQFKKRMDN